MMMQLQKIVGLFAFCLLALGFVACSDDSSSSSAPEELVYRLPDLPNDMIRVSDEKKSVVLGTSDSTALSRERPEMRVDLDYDYYLGKHEVTCEEFYKYIKFDDVDSSKCGKEPITNVSYYDAALYANARSKAEGFDTIYSYGKAWKDENGRCTMLTGIQENIVGSGYRLPTEAEWAYVAQRNWNVGDSWFGGNSSGEAHEVCTGNVDSDGFCDLSGNVMEWIGGWLGRFKDTTMTNYIGSYDANSLTERVIKGGSFHHDSSAIKLFSRGDVYTVSSTTKAAYLGFRLAFGSVQKPAWLASDGSSNKTSIKSLEDIETIRRITKAYRAILAFRNDQTGNLVTVDYNISGGAMKEYKDTLDVYHPDISPDGSKVVFCTKPEGVSGKSSIYVRNIKLMGAETVHLDVESAAIPRWRILPSGDTVIVYVTDSDVNSDSSQWKSKTTWQVSFDGDEFGEPEKLFEGSFHGGVSSDGKLAVTGARLLRARVDDEDTLWYNGEQACNVSLSKDESKRVSFLDFASETGKDFVGSSYKVHQRLFVTDSAGKLLKSVASPKGYAFDHTEWVLNDNQFEGVDNGHFVSALTNSNGAHTKISLINLKDSSVTDLISGDELWHPALWVKRAENLPISNLNKDLDLDSAAFYAPDESASSLAYKMNVFWMLADTVRVIGLGSSRMNAGYSPKLMKSNYGMNFGSVHVDMEVIDYLAQNYVFRHCKNLRYIIVGVDIDLWYAAKGENLRENLVPKRAFAYDENHNFWSDSIPAGFMELNKSYAMDLSMAKENWLTRGWNNSEAHSWTNGGFNSSAIVGDSTWSNDSKTYKANMEILKSLIKTAKEKDVVVIGVVFPQSPYYKKTGSFGRHGMRRSTAKDVLSEIESWTKDYSNFIYLDENKMGDHDYTDDMAFDYDHLALAGAKKLTTRIDSVMKALEKK